ncbi:MAG: metal ABC transporter permease [Cytophaga sp.]|uniref:metal ABC transporter permease n=1 Tax=Cytophaga sp. TaxID=29535 RepID=UPI003F7FA968
MNELIRFLLLEDPNVRTVVIGTILLNLSASVVGSFAFLQKKSLSGDAVAHSILPGICMAFIVFQTKSLWVLLPGAFITGWLSLYLVDLISHHSKLKQDTAIAVVLSVFFAIGIILLTYIQHTGSGAQSGLDSFLFGKAAALLEEDLITYGIISIVVIAVTAFFLKEFTLISFDTAYAASIGIPVRKLQLVLTTLTVIAIVTGIQSVGVVLMSAMLITPAVAARYWTDNLKRLLLLAVLFNSLAAVAGAYISYRYPSMPTGPWIVLIISIFAFASILFAPKKGLIYGMYRTFKHKSLILKENILKALYQLGEQENRFHDTHSLNNLLTKRRLPHWQVYPALYRLRFEGYLEHSHAGWALTPEGIERGKRIVRLHRLWEMYLSKNLLLASDHVHDDAETIEHILTPELEARLEKSLNFPQEDPHASKIPR